MFLLLQETIKNIDGESTFDLIFKIIVLLAGSSGLIYYIIKKLLAMKEKKEDFNIHCTVKPLGLIEELISLILPINKNKIIIDPFMGSGTTALAAKKLGVNYVGFEIVQHYVTVAQERLIKLKQCGSIK